ncbi:MAG TPA: GTPase Era [Chitinophagaceae bacterium]|nr:GTPase Era [Chitinophagaceae bacterium]
MHQAGFVNIFGKPNAGKSTLLNALVNEKLSIVSPKVQTTRHRIMGILNEPGYQIVFSDTPGLMEPRYKLQDRMMGMVKKALEDADLGLLVVDARDKPADNLPVFSGLGLKSPAILVMNKMDLSGAENLSQVREEYKAWAFVREVVAVSALKKLNLEQLLAVILSLLPEGENFFPEGELSDRPVRFFISELIQEQIFDLFREEIPYHTAVLVTDYQEKQTLVKIAAQIVVQRETQKAILLGEKGKAIRELGIRSRIEMEKFLGRKIFLELFVKVRPGWRDNDLLLREYGYA